MPWPSGWLQRRPGPAARHAGAARRPPGHPARWCTASARLSTSGDELAQRAGLRRSRGPTSPRDGR
eukprot:2291904-Alexandrium_andersonii.AAC.1